MPRTIDLIRHGQSTFNAHFEVTGEDPLHFDARLTEKGHAQAADARRLLDGKAYDLIVTSPLTRAVQTSLGIFADALGRVPFMVETLHRERVESSGDVGRPPAELAAEFKQLDFGALPDAWWVTAEPNHIGVPYEPLEHFLPRVEGFRDWLRRRPEKRIAVVGHATFFLHLTGTSLKNCEILSWQP